MTPNPILKVLSTLKKHHVKCLLIGGQACIVYGAAEFSRDSDFIILCTAKNLEFLKKALSSLNAELIYVPQLEKKYLENGHACHFRCMAKEVKNLRIDVISKLRGCEPFDKLWERRSSITLKDGHSIDVINLRDLVQSKKTQRDKDWPMLKRLGHKQKQLPCFFNYLEAKFYNSIPHETWLLVNSILPSPRRLL